MTLSQPNALPRRRPLLLRGGTLLTMDPRRRAVRGDLLVVGDRIARLGGRIRAEAGTEVLDCDGHVVLPGLVQAHVHLCQVLFRNQADGLELLDWLAQRIWPFEAAHDRRSLGFSARLGIAELLLGGTTALLDMGTVRHTDAVLEAALASGIRYTGGKCLMDSAGSHSGLREDTAAAMRETEALGDRWHGADGGRLRYALCPRFVLSCTEALLRQVRDVSARTGWLVHTHASENRSEIAAVRALAGMDNVAYFDSLGLAGPRLVLAHCVHVTAAEMRLMARTRTAAVHCPGANLKLASGVAPLPRLLERGVRVAIGGDGAPCNNTLDAFHEMRLAATLHLPRSGPRSVDPRDVLALATTSGADVLGLGDEIGSLEAGKRADVTVVDLRAPHLSPAGEDLHATVVYAARASDVRHVVVDGRLLVRDRTLRSLDAARLARGAGAEMARLRRRVKGESVQDQRAPRR